VLCFKFSIPKAQHMTDVAKLVASVFYFIDAVAKLTLSPAVSSCPPPTPSAAQPCFWFCPFFVFPPPLALPSPPTPTPFLQGRAVGLH